MGEPVVISEKADGANARFVYHNGEYHCGSRETWKKEFTSYSHVTLKSLLEKGCEEEKAKKVMDNLAKQGGKSNVWWQMFRKYENLQKFLRDNPGVVVSAESYGKINCIVYNFPDVNRIAVFDIMKDGKFLDHNEARDLGKDLPWAPVLAENEPYSFDMVANLAEGETTVPDAKPGTIREGCVIRPVRERLSDKVSGRLVLKCISSVFLEKYR